MTEIFTFYLINKRICLRLTAFALSSLLKVKSIVFSFVNFRNSLSCFSGSLKQGKIALFRLPEKHTQGKYKGTTMAYSDKVIDHYENPRNVGSMDKNDQSVGTGMVGAPACGDVMKLQIKVNENGIIEDAKFKTYGCGSAIASSSLVTEWVKGKSIDEALAIKNSEIAEELALPPVKIHCSVLAEDAIRAAVADYRKKQGE